MSNDLIDLVDLVPLPILIDETKRAFASTRSAKLSECIYKVYVQNQVIKSANEQFTYSDHLRFHIFMAERLFTSATVLGL